MRVFSWPPERGPRHSGEVKLAQIRQPSSRFHFLQGNLEEIKKTPGTKGQFMLGTARFAPSRVASNEFPGDASTAGWFEVS